MNFNVLPLHLPLSHLKSKTNKKIESQIAYFYDTSSSGFFSTTQDAKHVILRLKDGMDTSEPSTNGTSASNLYRLSSLLNDEEYGVKARQTIACFESEILQYPWLFATFMPGIVAGKFGVRGTVVFEPEKEGEVGVGLGGQRIKMYEKAPRGSLSTFSRLTGEGGWLRERNSLLVDFGRSGKSRVMVCEGGICREEGEDGGEGGSRGEGDEIKGEEGGEKVEEGLSLGKLKEVLLGSDFGNASASVGGNGNAPASAAPSVGEGKAVSEVEKQMPFSGLK